MSSEQQNEPREPKRRMVFCVVPRELAAKLHEPLRRHFREDAAVEVIVESRRSDRRLADERRATASGPGSAAEEERRRIRSPNGRRIGDRRAPAVAVDHPPLPRRLRGYADRLLFLELLEPSSERLEDLDTARVITCIQAGERDLFATVYLRYFDRIYSYLQVIFRHQQDAEDGTQQVFIKVLEALPEYEQRGRPFRAWLFTVARNYALNQLKRAGRLESFDAQPEAMFEEPAATDEQLLVLGWISDRELLMFFERLPLPQRQVLMMRCMLGFSLAETAEILERTPEAVRKLQSRGLAFLRERLHAVGRAPEHGQRGRSRRLHRQAPVVCARRFALGAPAARR